MLIHLPVLLAGLLAQTPSSTPVTAGWQDGFVVQSPNGDNRLVLGLTAQVDGKFAFDDPSGITDTFAIRKARPTVSGRVARYFEFKIMPDFGNGTPTLLDAYLDVRVSRRFRVRGGKDKTPVGYELLQGDPYLLFPERALASSLVPNRDVGFQAIGEITPHVTYAGGVFNGVPDGSSSTTDAEDTNDSKDVAGRITWNVGNGLGFHVGGSVGKETGTLGAFRTTVGRTYFSYLAGATAAGDRRRFSPAIFYYRKAFGAFAEYMRSTQDIARAAAASRVSNEAWEVTASYVLTGEAASDRGVKPAHAFDPQTRSWGALQVVARYSELHIDPMAFTRRLAAATAVANAAAWAIGVNWYPANPIKYYVMYEHTAFRGGNGVRPDEHALTFRVQLAF